MSKLKFNFNESLIYSKIENDEFLSEFNGKYLAIIFTSDKPPLLYEVSSSSFITFENVNDLPKLKATAIAMSSEIIAAGFENGLTLLWGIPEKKLIHRHKLIHENAISHLSFSAANQKLIIADEAGIISSFVVTIQPYFFAIETSIINLKSRLFSMATLDDFLAYSYKDGFSLIKTGRKNQVLIFNKASSYFQSACSLCKKGSLYRMIDCSDGSIQIIEFDNQNNKKTIISELSTLDAPVKLTLFIDFDHLVIILETGIGLLYDSQFILIKTYMGLPIEISKQNIHIFGSTLVSIGNQHIYQVVFGHDE